MNGEAQAVRDDRRVSDDGKTALTDANEPAANDLTNVGGLEVNRLKSPIAGPFSFSIPRGGCMSITGPSGSGKSLLLRMVADLDPNSGRVTLGGTERSAISAPAWRALCPYVAATPGFWERTAAEHFAEGEQARAIALAETMLFDAARFAAPIDRLSTGERQRIALVRALMLNSPALLLDEPTGPLDPDATDAVARLLAQRIAAGTCLLLVTHDDALAERLGSDRRTMRDRRLSSR